MAKDKSKAEGPKGRNDAYTMMLFITFAAILAGCILLYLDYDEYGKNPAPTPPKVEALKLGEDAGKAGATTTGPTDTKTNTPKTGGTDQ